MMSAFNSSLALSFFLVDARPLGKPCKNALAQRLSRFLAIEGPTSAPNPKFAHRFGIGTLVGD
jgi:hypothetical protein